MINTHLYTPIALAAIESALEPGEVGVAVCDFGVVGTKASCTCLVTNRNIRFLGFQFDKHQKSMQVVSNSGLALRTISGIATSEYKVEQFIGKKAVFRLTFWWEGHQETLDTYAVQEGKDLAEKLRERVASVSPDQRGTSVADEIERLAQLAQEGIITQEELTNAKSQLIGRTTPSQVDEAAKLLRQLFALKAQGILTESEYNMKKWDVLSMRLVPRDKPPA